MWQQLCTTVPVFATFGSRPSAEGTDMAALKFFRLNVVLNIAIWQ